MISIKFTTCKSFSLSMEFHKTIDATGLKCPMPILKCKKGLNELTDGQVLKIATTDKSAQKDFEAFCDQTGHQMLEAKIVENVTTFYIKKVKR